MQIPRITKGHLLTELTRDAIARELITGEFFLTIPEAQAFLIDLSKRLEFDLRSSPADADALNDDFTGRLMRSWERIHGAYGEDGRLRPEVAASVLPGKRLPAQIYDAAFQLLLAGKATSFDAAVSAVCAEYRAPIPTRIRAFETLSAAEPDLLAAEAQALAELAAARTALTAARASAVGLINKRDALQDAVSARKAELKELLTKRDLVTKRRERSADTVVRTLRPGAALMLQTIADLGSSVFGFDIALEELSRLIPAKEAEVTAAEEELAAFVTANAEELAPVEQ
jgi:hypothetical protein